MAETKNLLVSTGGGEAVPMNNAEYAALMKSLPPQARREVYVRGKITSVVTDNRDVPSREELSHDEVIARMQVGGDPVVTPGDGKLDAVRRSDQARIDRAIAGEEDALTAIHKVTPFIGHALQNAAVGPDVAAEHRAKLLEANTGLSMGLDMAMVAAGGFGVAKGLATVAPKLAAGMGKTTGIRGFANLMGGGAAADTYLYAEYLADTNTPFRAEDYGRELAMGALFNFGPSALGAARGAIVKGATAVASGGGDAMGMAADFYVTRAVMGKAGTGETAEFARRGAGFRMVSRLAQRFRNKKARVAAHVDPLEEAEKFARAQEKRINQATGKKVDGMTHTERQGLFDELRGVSGADDVLDVRAFDNVVEKTNAVRSTVKVLDKTVDGVNQKTGNWTKGIGGRASKKQAAAFQTEMTKTLHELKEAGFGEVTNYLEELLEVDTDGKLLRNPHREFGKLVQARLDARLKLDLVPGAAQADAALERIINNSEIFGKGKHPAVAKDINAAINDIADAQRQLGGLNIPKNLDDLGPIDLGRMDAIEGAITKIEKAYATLQRKKMLSYAQTAGIRKSLKQARAANTAGGEAYTNVSKLNRMREAANGNTTERLSRVAQGSADFKAAQTASALEDAGRLVGFGDHAKAVMNGAAAVTSGTSVGGVVMLRSLNRQEKNDMFDHLQTTLPSLTGAPEQMEEALQNVLGATDDADPDVSMMGGMAATRTLYYLAQAMPKQKQTTYYSKTPVTQQDAFLQKYAATQDPISVAYAALEGRATPSMIEAIRVTQPAMYAELSNFMAEAITEAEPGKASRKTINGVNAFIGGLDPLWRGDVLFQLQNHYAQNQVQSQAQGPGVGTGQLSTPNPKQGENNFTFTQRLTSY